MPTYFDSGTAYTAACLLRLRSYLDTAKVILGQGQAGTTHCAHSALTAPIDIESGLYASSPS